MCNCFESKFIEIVTKKERLLDESAIDYLKDVQINMTSIDLIPELKEYLLDKLKNHEFDKPILSKSDIICFLKEYTYPYCKKLNDAHKGKAYMCNGKIIPIWTKKEIMDLCPISHIDEFLDYHFIKKID